MKKNMLNLVLLFFGIIGAQPHQAASKENDPYDSPKVLVITWSFPWPVHTFVMDDIFGLINHGYDVYVYAMSQHNPTIDLANFLPAKYFDYDFEGRVFYDVKQLADHTDIDKFAILYCAFGHANLIEKCFQIQDKFCKDAKVAIAYQGFEILKTLGTPSLAKKVFAKADLILPVSRYFYQMLIDAQCDKNKVKVYYTGVDDNLFMPRRSWSYKEAPSFLSVGRLMEEKGFSFAIKAFARVHSKYPQAQYFILGEGNQRQELRNLIQTMHLEKNVHLMGQKKHDEIAHWLKKTDIFIMPSITGKQGKMEGIPNALKEAMFSALPCIGTRHAGIPELIEDHITGLLVDEHNIEQLVHAMERLLSDEMLRKRLGLAGNTFVKKYFTRTSQDDFLDREFKRIINC